MGAGVAVTGDRVTPGKANVNGCWFSTVCKELGREPFWWRLDGLSKKSKSWSVNISSPTTRSLEGCLVVEEVVGGPDGAMSDGGRSASV